VLGAAVPQRGDMIATGFTRLAWREALLNFSDPVFPSQVLLVTRSEAPERPIKPSGTIAADIKATRQLIGKKSLLVMEGTCLDPASYGLRGMGLDLRSYTRSTNLNEMVPAMLNREAYFTLLDVPDLIIDYNTYLRGIKADGSYDRLVDKYYPGVRTYFPEFFSKIRPAK
jgi:ABC-type amino acid transport substrate-binding protein